LPLEPDGVGYIAFLLVFVELILAAIFVEWFGDCLINVLG